MPPALRIAICAPYDLARAGGVNSHIRAQARALRDLGHAVRIFGCASAPLDGDEARVGSSVSAVIGGTETGIGVDPRAWFRVGRLLRREHPDIVHVHEPLMPFAPWCAVLRAAVPVVGTFHVYREEGHAFYPTARPLLSPLVRRLARRIAVSAAAQATVAREFPGEYDIVPNGIDVERFRTVAPHPPELSTEQAHVLFVGRLEPRKGVEHLVDAMARVQAQRSGVRLLVVGEGPDREALAARARRARVDATFVGGVSDDRLAAYFQAADVVCSPAVGGESFGIVLLEAMACGRPVVASSIPGYAELAGDAGSGARLVPPADAPALARELTALLGDAPLRDRLGAQGRAFAERFDWSAVARRLEAIYREALR